MFTNNNQSNKVGVALYIKNSIHVMAKPEQTFIRNGIETIYADLNTPSGIITVGPCGLGIRIQPTFALVRVVRGD